MSHVSTEFQAKMRERLTELRAEESALRDGLPIRGLGTTMPFNIMRLQGRIDELRYMLKEATKGDTDELSPRIPLLHKR